MSEDASGTAPTETCKLAAIMFADMGGCSRQMSADDARTLRVRAVQYWTMR